MEKEKKKKKKGSYGKVLGSCIVAGCVILLASMLGFGGGSGWGPFGGGNGNGGNGNGNGTTGTNATENYAANPEQDNEQDNQVDPPPENETNENGANGEPVAPFIRIEYDRIYHGDVHVEDFEQFVAGLDVLRVELDYDHAYVGTSDFVKATLRDHGIEY